MTSPASSSRPAVIDEMDSSPEVSPRRSWRTTSQRPPEFTFQHHGRSSSLPQPRSSASSHSRSRRVPSPQPPPRRSRTRGRSPRPHTRERSPLARPAATATSRVSVHSRLGNAAPSPAPARGPVHSRLGTPVIPTSPQPGTSTGIYRPPPPLMRIPVSSSSTWTAPSPKTAETRPASPEVSARATPARPLLQLQPRTPVPVLPAPPPPVLRTPPRRAVDESDFELPRTPGNYSSPELDLTRHIRLPIADYESTEEDTQWDQFSSVTVAQSVPPVPQVPAPEAPLTWMDLVELVYSSGLIDPSAIPQTPAPVQSLIGGPQAPEKRKSALPPSPLAAACLPAAMRACWGGDWPSYAQHQPPPPNAALHPGPASWVPEFKAKYHAAPGLDLRPARPSAREREWAGTAQPPVAHTWLMDIETMARAQLAALSNLEWLFGVFLDSRRRASPRELDAVRGYIARELQHAMNFGGAQIAASTLGRRQAILDSLQLQLNQTTRNWLQLQLVELRTHQGLFRPDSTQVPEIMHQQPVPRQQPPR